MLTKQAESLILNNLSLARMIALKYYRIGMNKVRCNLDDLEQEGRIGLIKAARKFDASRKIRFNTFATKFIQGQIITFLYSNHLVSIPVSKQKDKKFKFPLVRDYEYYEESLLLNKNYDLDEIVNFRIQKEKVIKASKGLKSRKQQIINLVFNGYKQADIARLFCISETLVGFEMMEIRNKLKKALI